VYESSKQREAKRERKKKQLSMISYNKDGLAFGLV